MPRDTSTVMDRQQRRLCPRRDQAGTERPRARCPTLPGSCCPRGPQALPRSGAVGLGPKPFKSIEPTAGWKDETLGERLYEVLKSCILCDLRPHPPTPSASPLPSASQNKYSRVLFLRARDGHQAQGWG